MRKRLREWFWHAMMKLYESPERKAYYKAKRKYGLTHPITKQRLEDWDEYLGED